MFINRETVMRERGPSRQKNRQTDRQAVQKPTNRDRQMDKHSKVTDA